MRSTGAIKNRIMTALCIALCLAVSVGIAVAYFTDYENAKGGAVLSLNGSTETQEDLDRNGKTIAIYNNGDTDMAVRVMIFGDTDLITVGDSSSWTASAAESADGVLVYYYNGILHPGKTTPELRAEISGRVSETDPVSFDITVVHESSRVTYTQDESGGNVVAAPDGWAGFPLIAAED